MVEGGGGTGEGGGGTGEGIGEGSGDGGGAGAARAPARIETCFFHVTTTIRTYRATTGPANALVVLAVVVTGWVHTAPMPPMDGSTGAHEAPSDDTCTRKLVTHWP